VLGQSHSLSAAILATASSCPCGVSFISSLRQWCGIALTTSSYPSSWFVMHRYMTRGALKGNPDVYAVGDGCGSPQGCIDAQKEFNAPGNSPFMCSECYTGWLTHWGEGGANTSSAAPLVDSILGKFNGSGGC
jgi:hypothetical protein